jgi:hypothetical protein
VRPLTTWIIVAMVWLCSWGPASGTEADDAELAHRLKQLGTAFEDSCKDCGYGFIDPESAALLDRLWMLLEDWSIRFLETHPEQVHIDTAIRALGREFDPRWEPLNADVEFLDVTAYLVRLEFDRFGRVLIVSPVGGQLVVTWRLADQPVSVVRKFPELAAWSSREQQSAVCAKLPDEPFCQMGVSARGFGILPDGADGSRRFYVLSTYLKEAGCAAWSELSIWAWRKNGTVPLLANWYFDNCEYGETRLDGRLLHVQVQSSFKTFWACASCRNRELDWAIAIGPNGVKDLGKTEPRS